MLITTSRRPGHRARILCRELARVLSNVTYTPRGAKTVRNLVSLASSLGHSRVVVINSIADDPREMRFFDAVAGLRWLNARIEFGGVKLQRDLGQKIKLAEVRIFAEGKRAWEFADFLGKLLNLPISREPPGSGAVALITEDEGLKLQFQAKLGSEIVGPVLEIASFGEFFGEGE